MLLLQVNENRIAVDVDEFIQGEKQLVARIAGKRAGWHVFQKRIQVNESVIGVTPSETFTKSFGQEVVNLTITISVCGQEGRDGAQVEDVKALGVDGKVHCLVSLSIPLGMI
jgi:hypothetical protein